MRRLVTLILFTASLTLHAGEADPPRQEGWDWASAAKQVLAKHDGPEGVVLQLGDSITYANQYARWAQRGAGKDAGDKAVLKWMHTGKRNDQDGWHLCSVDVQRGRSHTAASGVRADQYIKGGKHGLPSLDAIIGKYDPQMAVVMLGTNDASAGRDPDAYIADMTTIVEKLHGNGTVAILTTLPPHAKRMDLIKAYNERLWALAEAKKLPVIDFYGHVLSRRSGESWKGTLISKDGVHPTHTGSNGAQPQDEPSEENLANCGYLLRGYITVQKLKQVVGAVIGG